MHDFLKRLSERLLKHGTETVAKETETRFFEEQNKQIHRLLEVAEEAIDKAEAFAADGNTAKRRIANLISQSVGDASERIALGRFEVPKGGVPLEEDPFGENSAGSLTGSNDSIKALPSSSPTANGNEQLPAPKKVGRPKGSKNKPRPPRES